MYVEKPLSLTVAKGRKMVDTTEADRETGRQVVSTVDRRSSSIIGGLGEVTVVKGRHIQNEYPNGIGATGTPAERTGLGPLARPGAESAV